MAPSNPSPIDALLQDWRLLLGLWARSDAQRRTEPEI